MAFNPGAKFMVERFDGTGNFGLWQRRVKDLLAQQGLSKALRENKPEDMDQLDWDELKERAAGTIRLCLEDKVMYHVMDILSPTEVWEKLEKQFMSKSLMNKLYLKQRLYGLKMQEESDLQQHINSFNQTIADLCKLDVKVDDEDKAIILLCSLPGSYEHLVTTLTYGKDSINLDEITAALLSHSQRRQNAGEGSQGDSLYVKGSQGSGRKGGGADSAKGKQLKAQGRQTVRCYKCKQIGHYKRECPNRQVDQDDWPGGASGSETGAGDASLAVGEDDFL